PPRPQIPPLYVEPHDQCESTILISLVLDKARLNPRLLASRQSVPAVQDHPLIADDRLTETIGGKVGRQGLQLLRPWQGRQRLGDGGGEKAVGRVIRVVVSPHDLA